MNNVLLLNKIAKIGTAEFDSEKYNVGDSIENPELIMVRSAAMHEMTFGDKLIAIGRAGAGVNNIPVDECAKQGIAVFNTPGANANGVKELAIAALLLASRDIVGGVNWAQSLTEDVAKSVEKGKSKFAGSEIKGKTLGVIGLGAIGGMVANTALALGMKVIGYDPFVSVNAAWRLSADVKCASGYDEIYEKSDYITLHVPATKDTKGMINSTSIAKMKNGAKIINLARADLVNASDLKAALEEGKLSSYVTDFPTEEVLGVKGIVTIPHLGASTEESEDNCAVMAAQELIDYAENGNIKNSVNYPALSMARSGKNRICVIYANAPETAAAVVAAVAAANANASASAVRGDYAYMIADTDSSLDEAVNAVKAINGVIKVRAI